MQPFRSIVLLALALPGAVYAQSTVGLPTGGRLDPRKVVETRYAAEAEAPAVEAAKPGKSKPDKARAENTQPDTDSRVRVKPVAGSVATVAVDNTDGGKAGEPVPVTFGQVFPPGAIGQGKTLRGTTADGTPVPLQVDAKAAHPDGSLRHAVVSALLPRPAAARPLALALWPAERAETRGAGIPGGGAPAIPVTVSVLIDGKRYTASPSNAQAKAQQDRWLSGPIVDEWQVAVPLRSAPNEAHPHLVARFALRQYPGARRARVDVTVENNWAYEPAPSNLTYDVDVVIDGQSVYAKPGLVHYHHARWRKVFWTGGDPGVAVRHSPEQLMASRAIPQYDPSLQIAEKALSKLYARWEGPRSEPMATGQAAPKMPTTGGRPDIGLLPGWTAMYVLSGDLRARRVTLGTGDLAGSFSTHYRDKRTGLPVSLLDFPYMTLLGNASDTRNPATGQREAFPGCVVEGACSTPHKHDVSHQPSLAYVPYLLTGDYYYLEELQFWAMYNTFSSNPNYRENRKGLLKAYQVRGQAWSLRTLAHAAYITPDSHPLKSHFMRILDGNLDWYNAKYSNNPQANKLGVNEERYAVVYRKKTAVSPWQDDFFTAAAGHAAELGFKKAEPLLAWKSKFPVGRMTGKGFCWIGASMYSIKVRDNATGPLYDTMEQVYRASQKPEALALPCGGPEMAAALKLAPGEMPGYSSSPSGFPSNMQPALAYAAGAAGEAARAAWERFMTRSVKPDYNAAPQFAIVPR